MSEPILRFVMRPRCDLALICSFCTLLRFSSLPRRLRPVSRPRTTPSLLALGGEVAKACTLAWRFVCTPISRQCASEWLRPVPVQLLACAGCPLVCFPRSHHANVLLFFIQDRTRSSLSRVRPRRCESPHPAKLRREGSLARGGACRLRFARPLLLSDAPPEPSRCSFHVGY